MSSATADPEPEPPEQEAHVRPEDLSKVGGAQSVSDKVETFQRAIEAGENQPDRDLRSNGLWYAALLLAFIVGSLMSGFSVGSGDGGGSVVLGMVDVLGSGVIF